MFQRVEIESPTLKEIGEGILPTAEFHSVFFRPSRPGPTYPDFGRGAAAVLTEVIESDFLRTSLPWLVPVYQGHAKRFSLLNRFEFEGSLIHFLLHGTCTERIVRSQPEAREIVQKLLTETVLRIDGVLCGYRMDDPNWSELTRNATFSAAYFVYAPQDVLWWFMGMADDY